MAAPHLLPEPPLPRGERIELPGRGSSFVRVVSGPPGAPTVVLLHGWMASGGLNWFNAFEALSQRYNVVAPDARGHGRGIRSRRRFRLADCADDVAVLIEELDTGPVIAVGYSMGGPIAQLLWHRHPEHVQGMVLCATAYRFVAGARERFVFASLMGTAAGTTRAGAVLARLPVASLRRWGPHGSASPPSTMSSWAAGEMGRHDIVKIMEAGAAIGNYNAHRWISDIDVPTTVVVTERDHAIDAREQRKMAALIPGAVVQGVEDGHVVCAKREFGPIMVRAVDSVHDRIVAARSRGAAG
ncbi:MAG: alpha/beta fold hydrolase [Acidimicrobiia bacterium]|nr:alpha/beta fold hydrolase [Acidimicrobiia bacterium]